MKIEMMPVIDSYDLEEAMKLQYGPDFFGENEFIEPILFGEEYSNDIYKFYYFINDEIFEGKSWQNEERIRIRNCINGYLRDILPDCERVLISISW